MRSVLVALLVAGTTFGAKPPGEILVVKRANISAFQEAAEEFSERCRVRARVVNLESGLPPLGSDDVVLALGQSAVEAVGSTPARLIAALAPVAPRHAIIADGPVPPAEVLRAIQAARPSARRIGVVAGPLSDRWLAPLQRAARAAGLSLVMARGTDGPQAVRELAKIAPAIDALWLLPDPSVLTTQLFQFALRLEIQHAMPVVAPTRHQVKTGALLAVDWPARLVGRHAAELTNRLLAGLPLVPPPTRGFELTVNSDVAHRLGVELRRLAALGARVE